MIGHSFPTLEELAYIPTMLDHRKSGHRFAPGGGMSSEFIG
jgi:hypothetical protein